MSDFDVGAIVPSTRDLLQVLATRKKSLALVGLVGGSAAGEHAARLSDQNVSAFSAIEAGPAMQAAARATKTVPMLLLTPVKERDDFLRARFFGADGVVIDAKLAPDEWDRLAKTARTTRMAPLALATDDEGVKGAVAAGAKALVVRASSADEALRLAGLAPRAMTVLAFVDGADDAAIRALAKNVDAAVVHEGLHASSAFDALVAEVDP